jgi:hypothetical protein
MGIETALLVAAIAGTAMEAGSAIMEGNAAKAQAETEAELLDRQGAQVRDNALRQESLVRRRGAQQRGAARAAAGMSGALNTGSTLEALAQDAAGNELDALTVRYDGLIKQNSLASEAEIRRFEGRQAKKAGFFKALVAVGKGAAMAGGSGGFGGGPSTGGGVGAAYGSTGAQAKSLSSVPQTIQM